MKKLLLPLWLFCSVIDAAEAVNLLSKAPVSFWNHIVANPTGFSQLDNAKNAYSLSWQPIQNSCDNEAIELTLVKKLVNWEQQHANGIELDLSSVGLTFADLDNVQLKLKLDLSKSKLAKLDQLQLAYAETLTQAEVMSVYNGSANINVQFYGENHSNPKIPTVYAGFLLDISSKEHTEAWQSHSIEQSEFSFYSQQNWNESPLESTQIGAMKVKGLLLMADNHSGKVLRSLLQENFSSESPEYLLQLAVSICEIKLL